MLQYGFSQNGRVSGLAFSNWLPTGADAPSSLHGIRCHEAVAPLGQVRTNLARDQQGQYDSLL
jgi:hypothetical protein